MSLAISPSVKALTRRLSRTNLMFDESEPLDRGETAKREGRFVFEAAWEVANKVGGIYTVLRTKAGVTVEELGDQYCMLGPYNQATVALEVELQEPDYGSPTWQAIQHLGEMGCKEIWEQCHIGIPTTDRESNDAVILGFMIAIFLQKVQDVGKHKANLGSGKAGVGKMSWILAYLPGSPFADGKETEKKMGGMEAEKSDSGPAKVVSGWGECGEEAQALLRCGATAKHLEDRCGTAHKRFRACVKGQRASSSPTRPPFVLAQHGQRLTSYLATNCEPATSLYLRSCLWGPEPALLASPNCARLKNAVYACADGRRLPHLPDNITHIPDTPKTSSSSAL